MGFSCHSPSLVYNLLFSCGFGIEADLKWASLKTLEQLQIKLDELLGELTPEIIASLTGYSFILDALSVVTPI